MSGRQEQRSLSLLQDKSLGIIPIPKASLALAVFLVSPTVQAPAPQLLSIQFRSCPSYFRTIVFKEIIRGLAQQNYGSTGSVKKYFKFYILTKVDHFYF